MTLEDRYFRATITPSDINEHLPAFVGMCCALNAKNVIELGTRGAVSTVAWLYGLEMTGGHLWSVDIDPAPPLPEKNWTFIRGDDLDLEVIKQLPDEVDVVFIDTSHAYQHTLAELNIYRWKVRPGGKIVLHDTELHRVYGLTNQPPYPVRCAVEQFCFDEDLSVEFRTNNNGLGIISIPED